MLLAQYLQDHKIRPDKFAEDMGVKPVTVYRWIKGDRFPRKHLQEIAKATNGEVTANDFVQAAA